MLLLEFELHFDATMERCAIVDGDAPRTNVALNPTARTNGHRVLREDMPMHFARDFDAVCVHRTHDRSVSSDRKRPLQIEFALENPFDSKVTLAIETTPHHEMGADHPLD